MVVRKKKPNAGAQDKQNISKKQELEDTAHNTQQTRFVPTFWARPLDICETKEEAVKVLERHVGSRLTRKEWNRVFQAWECFAHGRYCGMVWKL